MPWYISRFLLSVPPRSSLLPGARNAHGAVDGAVQQVVAALEEVFARGEAPPDRYHAERAVGRSRA